LVQGELFAALPIPVDGNEACWQRPNPGDDA
jgi:hypothetical protein